MTFCVAKALSVRHADWFGIVAVQVILSLSVDALPLPGAAGANELVFLRIQSRFFPPNKLDAGLLLNRGLTYYFLLICCGAFTMCANFIRKKRHHGYLMEPGGEAPPAADTPPEGEETPEESGGEPESKES